MSCAHMGFIIVTHEHTHAHVCVCVSLSFVSYRRAANGTIPNDQFSPVGLDLKAFSD
jgi:hypothetical protein